MEKLTKKEKQERLEKAKKVAHKVMHIVGYVSLGLLGLVLCLTASKCSKVKTQDNVQVQEVARPYDEPQFAVNSSNTYTYVLNENADIEGAFPSDVTNEIYALSGTLNLEDGNATFGIVNVNLVASSSDLTIKFLNGSTALSEQIVYQEGYISTFSGIVSISFDDDPTDLNEILSAIAYPYVEPDTPDTSGDNNEVIVSLGSAWTQAITGFAGVLASSVNSIVAIFYANNSLTFLGTLLCISMGVGVVYWAFRLIRGLIRNRG